MQKRDARPPRDLIKAPLSERDKLRLSLTRKLAAVLDEWRICPARACRRQRRCVSPALVCTTLPVRRTCTPEQEQAAMARLRRMLERRRESLERKEGA